MIREIDKAKSQPCRLVDITQLNLPSCTNGLMPFESCQLEWLKRVFFFLGFFAIFWWNFVQVNQGYDEEMGSDCGQAFGDVSVKLGWGT